MIDSRFERVSETVRAEMERLPIPGVAVGVLFDGHAEMAGFGITSVENPLPVTPDTLFQIGSISKTYLGTLVMRLVELGKLDLHAPLITYIPELNLKDEHARQNATMFHCLTHTGGWLGDYFQDHGRGEDSLARMVDAMAELPQQTSLGSVWSYNNAGFYLAGRAIEVVTEMPFEQAMQEYIFDPLGLTNSFFFAEDVISRAFVVGHLTDNDKPTVTRPWALSRTAHPAGGIICNIPDLFRYAQFHMRHGRLEDGTPLLSRQSIEDMQTPRFASTDPQSVGLTWYIREVNGEKLLGHNGGTNGQQTSLQIAPAHKLAFAILTNGDHGTLLINNVMTTILEQYLEVPPAELTPVTMDAAQLQPYLGRYDAPMDWVDVSFRDGDIYLQVTNKGGFPDKNSPPPPTQPPPVRVAFYGQDKLFARDDPYKDSKGEFLRDANGEIEWLRLFSRIHKKANG